MLKSLHIVNGFKHHNVTYKFEKGVTAIVGQNESGKSLIFEFIRFGLWGTKALRGAASEYKKLEITLQFTVKGTDYEVYRGKSNDTLREWKVDKYVDIVKGTGPVNRRIVSIFGYDMVVFDMANCCNQDEINALGRMLPAERKRMVDQTIGLQYVDQIAVWAGSESNAAKKAHESMGSVLREPRPPTDPCLVPPPPVQEPDGSILGRLRGELAGKRSQLERRTVLEAALRAQPTAPIAPPECAVKESEGDLIQHQMKALEAHNRVRIIESNLNSIPNAPYTEAQLVEFVQQIEAYGKWKQKEDLMRAGTLECPECHHVWPLRSADIEKLDNPAQVEPPPAGVTLTKVAEWDKIRIRAANKPALERELLDAQAKLAELPDRANDLSIVRTHDAAVRAYSTLHRQYIASVERLDATRVELQSLPDAAVLRTEVESLERSVEEQIRAASSWSAYQTAKLEYDRQVKMFEDQKKSYEADKAEYDELVLKIEREKELADGWALGRDAIQDLKIRIKKYLVPSLNTVASHLVALMTGGVRSRVTVDEEFNIKVDGRELRTLSGSGNSVANLALRMGLGQVLTNRTFPVFMADEIDSAMDSIRAEATMKALASLTKYTEQVFIISHKKIAADHYIEL